MNWQIPDNLRNQKAAVVVIWPKENILQIAWSFLENIDNAEKLQHTKIPQHKSHFRRSSQK